MCRRICPCVAAALLVTAPAAAQDATWSWENATELSFVSTGGNASSSTFGLKASLAGTGALNAFKLEVGGIRAKSDFTTRTASTGTPTVITETTLSELTAENSFARGRYDRGLGAGFVFGGAGWDRNTFAGIRNRYVFVGGFGRTWYEGDGGRLKTDLGGTYTIQKDVAPVPGEDDAFGGARITIDATRPLTATTDFSTTLVADQNLEERGDFRADWVSSIAVAISEGLALKTSLQLLYDSEPAFVSVPVVDPVGVPTGDEVLISGEEIDHIMTLTLVIKL